MCNFIIFNWIICYGTCIFLAPSSLIVPVPVLANGGDHTISIMLPGLTENRLYILFFPIFQINSK